MKKNIIITTGGTAGHIYPMLSLYDYLSNKGYKINFITDHRGKKYLHPQMLEEVTILNINSPYNLKGFLKIYSFFRLFYACIYSFIFLILNRPNLVIGSGGYASFPVLIAAQVLRINIILYETNVILGKTNKFFYDFCKKLLVGCDDINFFPQKFKSVKTKYVGQILRSSFLVNTEKKIFHDELSLLVIGGSQSSEFFGTNLVKILLEINKEIIPLKIYHQSKIDKFEEIKLAYGEFKNYELFDFNPNIENLMSESDIAITRSGSSTLAELVAVNLPFIAIPLPSSLDNHQFYNAKYYENKGCCWILEQHNFKSESLKKIIIDIVNNNRELLNKKIQNMKLLSQINSLENFEKEIISYL